MKDYANCWDVMDCGRGPGGRLAATAGICPAARDVSADGRNHGHAAGRLCWSVPDTICGLHVADKFGKCLNCRFFQMVLDEEERFFDLGLEARPTSRPIA